MNKTVLRLLGIFFIIGGIIICAVAGFAKEENEPQSISMGYVVNGEYNEVDNGYIGGDSEAQEEMGYLSGIGIITIIIGGVSLVASFVKRSAKKVEYDY